MVATLPRGIVVVMFPSKTHRTHLFWCCSRVDRFGRVINERQRPNEVSWGRSYPRGL
jgi:hypothetical protein